MPKTSSPKHACVEDVDPITGEIDPDSRKFANSAAKRSNQSLKKGDVPRPGPTSDSGVSGLSQASQVSSGSGRTPKPAKSSRPSEEHSATVKRRPTVSEQRERPRESAKDGRPRSPDKPVVRRDSTSRRPGSVQYSSEYPVCTDPNCRDNYHPASQRHQSRPSIDNPISYPPQFAPPLASHQPPPLSYRQPPPPQHGQPVGSRPRGMSSTARPVSYHGGYYAANPNQPASYEPAYPNMNPDYRNSPIYDPFTTSHTPHTLPIPTHRPNYIPPAHLQPVTASPMRASRPLPQHTTTDDGLNFSTRASVHNPAQPRSYDLPVRQKTRDADDLEFNTRPGSYQLPGSFPADYDTSESSPERAPQTAYRNDRDRMPPPASFPAPRPSLRSSRTTSDAVPRHMERSPDRPTYRRRDTYYDSPSDHYDTDRTERSTKAVIADSRRQSGSRQSERSYDTYVSDPVGYGRRDERRYHPSRRISDYGSSGPRHKQDYGEADADEYMARMRGFIDEPMSAEWLRKERGENARLSNTGHLKSHVSDSSKRSHKSRQSISSHTSNKGGVIVQYNENTFELPMGAHLSVEQSPESGRSRVIIEDGNGRERGYVHDNSVRSSGQTSSGARSHRSRAESATATRGRRNSVRPERRQSDLDGYGV